MTANTHELKTWPEYFEETWSGRKAFELRRDDRGFKEGDTVTLREWNPYSEKYTGRLIVAQIGYILRNVSPLFGLSSDFCILSITIVGNAKQLQSDAAQP